MKNTILAILIIINVFSSTLILAQDNYLNKYNKNVSNIQFEKIYIHTDRENYTTKEDVWLKIYLVDGKQHAPLKGPANVYVDLVDNEGKVKLHKLYLAENGFGNGSFQLPSDLLSGKYTLCSYTANMKKFGEKLFFRKEISVTQILMDENRTAYSPKEEISKSTNAFLPDSKKISLQFMPEGGYLSYNLMNTLAFKIVTPDGKGANINGAIHDQFGNIVDSLIPEHYGMGKIDFVPYTNIEYFALLEGFPTDTFRLPAARKVPNIKYLGANDSLVSFRFSKSNTTKGNQYFALIKSKGIASLFFPVSFKNKNITLKIEKNNFITGLNQIMLFDQNLNPLAERLFFISGIPQSKIKIETSKKTYKTRERTLVDIKVNTNELINGNFSLSAVNIDQIGTDRVLSENIIAYLELSSELRGNIENSEYYFSSSFNKIQNKLDLLLLTQGWSQYVWNDRAIDSLAKNIYEREYGLTIEGKAKRLLLNKALIEGEITLLIPDYSVYLDAKTDSTGIFSWDHFVLHDSTKVIVAGKTKKGKKNVEIIDFDYIIPEAPSYSANYNPFDSIQQAAYLKKAMSRFINDSYMKFDENTILIDEVSIVDQKKSKYEDSTIEGSFGFADEVLSPSEKDLNYVDLFQYLQVKVPGISITGDYVVLRSRGSSGIPLFILDGMEVEANYVQNMPLDQVESIKVNKSERNASMFADTVRTLGVIAIYTKEGFEWTNPSPSFDILGKIVEGFEKPKKFYSPDYEGAEKDQNTPDIRATVHWEPNIIPDSKGNYSLSYFNSDDTGNIVIIVQGILNNGTPGYAKIFYHVK